jgi:hypothetical protein
VQEQRREDHQKGENGEAYTYRCPCEVCSLTAGPDGSNRSTSPPATSKTPWTKGKKAPLDSARGHPRSGSALSDSGGGTPEQDLHARHRSRSLTLGLGLLHVLHLLPPIHQPIGRWNPQIWQIHRGVAACRHASSMVRTHAHTWLLSGNRCLHHQVKGKEKK